MFYRGVSSTMNALRTAEAIMVSVPSSVPGMPAKRQVVAWQFYELSLVHSMRLIVNRNSNAFLRTPVSGELA